MTVEPSQPGYRLCNKCGRRFRSPDVIRIRRCARCHRNEDVYSPRIIHWADVRAAARKSKGS